MCKIMMFAGIKPNKVAQAWRWAYTAQPLLNESDDHGFGYAVASEGRIFGERWVIPDEAFARRKQCTKSERHMLSQFGTAVKLSETYNSFGDLSLSTRAQAFMLHARFATCSKNLPNTHPFVHEVENEPSTALIHNGVISNASKLQNRTSTCDSECILNEYGDSGVARMPENIQDVADLLQGYYACGVLSNDGEQQILDVFKSARASLYVAWVYSLGTYVFCTSEDIIRTTAKLCRMRIGSVAEVSTGFLLRLDVATGRCISVTPFEDEPPAYLKQEAAEEWDKPSLPYMLTARNR